jgi:SAM-dependent methyltransferase
VSVYVTRTTCRVCDGLLIPVVDLGEHHLSGFHKIGEDKGPKVPMVLTYCDRCDLVQLRDTTNPDLMFADTYWYRSGINETMRAALADIAHEAEEIADLQPRDAVLDIGANDGTLLLSYTRPDIVKVACEPANNLLPILWRLEKEGKIDVIFSTYFSAPKNPLPIYKAVTAVACVYDLDEPLTFLKDVKKVLAPDGIFIVQMSYLDAMLATSAYDVICHEHLENWSTRTFEFAVMQAGLVINHVSYNKTNGGSARYYIHHSMVEAPQDLVSRVSNFVLDKYGDALTLDQNEPDGPIEKALDRFRRQTIRNQYVLLAELNRLKYEGKKVYALGASTKFNTVLQYCGIGPDLITAIADRDPRKHGLVTPTDIPIVSEEDARAAHPDVFVLGAWQFKDMLMEREAAFLKRGGEFLVPFPYPHFERGERAVFPAEDSGGRSTDD